MSTWGKVGGHKRLHLVNTVKECPLCKYLRTFQDAIQINGIFDRHNGNFPHWYIVLCILRLLSFFHLAIEQSLLPEF